MLFLSSADFFKINFFKKLFREYHQNVKQFGPRSGPSLCRARSGSKLFVCLLGNFYAFLSSADFFQNQPFRKILSGIPSVSNSLDPDLGPNSLQTLCLLGDFIAFFVVC